MAESTQVDIPKCSPASGSLLLPPGCRGSSADHGRRPRPRGSVRVAASPGGSHVREPSWPAPRCPRCPSEPSTEATAGSRSLVVSLVPGGPVGAKGDAASEEQERGPVATSALRRAGSPRPRRLIRKAAADPATASHHATRTGWGHVRGTNQGAPEVDEAAPSPASTSRTMAVATNSSDPTNTTPSRPGCPAGAGTPGPADGRASATGLPVIGAFG